MTTLRTVTAEARGQSLAGKTAIVHTVDMTQPAKAIYAKLVVNGADVAALADRLVGYVAVCVLRSEF